MDCVRQSLPLNPVVNASLPTIDFRPPESAWPRYLAQYPTLAIFNEPATREVAHQSLVSCRDWDDVCQDSKQVFGSATNLGVCSLYYNFTTAVNDTDKRTAAVQKTETTIPTCLISYCAREKSCSQNAMTNCSIASLLSTGGHLSSQGVGRCWAEICEGFTPSVNPDIAGLGVRRPMTRSMSHLLTLLLS